MAKYNPQSEIPVPLSMNEIEYLKSVLRLDEKWPVGPVANLINKSILDKLDRVLPRGEMIHAVPWAEKYFNSGG